MPETKCTSCQQLLRFKDALAGKTIRCPKCKSRLTIPGAVIAEPEPEPVLSVSTTDTSSEAVFETQELNPMPAPKLNQAEDEDPFADDDSEDAAPVSPRKKTGKKKRKKKGGMGMLLIVLLVVVLLGGGGVGGYFLWQSMFAFQPLKTNPSADHSQYDYSNPGDFLEDAESNRNDEKDEKSLLALEFLNQEGKTVRLQDFKDKKHVVLVFMRGFTKDPGGICPSCSVQSSRLISRYKDFADRDAEILVVYPGQKDKVEEYVSEIEKVAKKETFPFPVWMDVDFAAVKQLNIEHDKAKPSTFIISKEGHLVFGFVGETSVQRPTLNVMLRQLDALQPKTSDSP